MEVEQFNAFYARTYEDTRRYVLSRCACAADAADILQNSYLAFYQQMRKGTSMRRPEAYRLSIVRRELGRQYGWAKRARKQVPVFTPDESENFDALEGAFLSEEIDESRLVADEVWKQIRQLDPLTYPVFLLYFAQQHTLSEIARELGCRESMVKSRLYRALKKLREQFG